MNNQSNNNKIYFYLKENSQKVLFTCRMSWLENGWQI